MSTDSSTRGNHSPEKQRSRKRENRPNKSAPRLSGDLLLMAALIGVSRALFGSAKPTHVFRARRVKSISSARGRSAEAPSEIPAKGWMDIAWRVLGRLPERPRHAGGSRRHILRPVGPVSGDRRGRVPVRALYRRNHHYQPSGPARRISSRRRPGCHRRPGEASYGARPRHAGVHLHWHLGAILVGRERCHQGDLRRPQHHLQGTREEELHPADAALARLHAWRHPR